MAALCGERVGETIGYRTRLDSQISPATRIEVITEGILTRRLQRDQALEGVGLERVDPAGQPFDPNIHEAVMTMPAASPEADHTVGSVFQPGYRLNGTLVRPARVAVLTWTEPAAEGAEQ